MIGEKLRQLRGERSPREMAEELHMTLQEYERIKASIYPVGNKTLKRLSDALEINAAY